MDPATDHPLIRKLESIAAVSGEERQAILTLPLQIRDFKPDQDIVREHDRPSQCCLILDGFVCRYKILSGGRRQIFSFHHPGDFPDLQSLHLAIMDHSVATITPSKLAFIPHQTLRAFIRAHPRIGDVFWRDTLIDAAVFRQWLLGVGRKDAYGRIAHLFCELFVRLRAVGLTNGHDYEMPITQAEVGDALGLTPVHVNRSLQALRGDGLIETKNGRLSIRNWDKLKEAGEFDPIYLHLKTDTRKVA
jgi:CRP-like cAMP-binding protein